MMTSEYYGKWQYSAKYSGQTSKYLKSDLRAPDWGRMPLAHEC